MIEKGIKNGIRIYQYINIYINIYPRTDKNKSIIDNSNKIISAINYLNQ